MAKLILNGDGRIVSEPSFSDGSDSVKTAVLAERKRCAAIARDKSEWYDELHRHSPPGNTEHRAAAISAVEIAEEIERG